MYVTRTINNCNVFNNFFFYFELIFVSANEMIILGNNDMYVVWERTVLRSTSLAQLNYFGC